MPVVAKDLVAGGRATLLGLLLGAFGVRRSRRRILHRAPATSALESSQPCSGPEARWCLRSRSSGWYAHLAITMAALAVAGAGWSADARHDVQRHGADVGTAPGSSRACAGAATRWPHSAESRREAGSGASAQPACGVRSTLLIASAAMLILAALLGRWFAVVALGPSGTSDPLHRAQWSEHRGCLSTSARARSSYRSSA